MFDVSATFEIIARSLDLCAMRHAVHSANVANAEVEGYRRLELQLAEDAGADTPVPGASEAGAQVIPTTSAVELDVEMAALARNALHYQVLLGAFQREMSMLQLAVKDGRGV